MALAWKRIDKDAMLGQYGTTWSRSLSLLSIRHHNGCALIRIAMPNFNRNTALYRVLYAFTTQILPLIEFNLQATLNVDSCVHNRGPGSYPVKICQQPSLHGHGAVSARMSGLDFHKATLSSPFLYTGADP